MLIRWQIVLITFDLVQVALLFFSIGMTVFMIATPHMIDWAELIVSLAVQLMASTDVRSPGKV